MTAQATEGWVPNDSEFASRLALIRNRMGWNAKEAALACGLPAQSWRNWESGKRPHDYARVCQMIADRTGASLTWLALGGGGGGVRKSSFSSPFRGVSQRVA